MLDRALIVNCLKSMDNSYKSSSAPRSRSLVLLHNVYILWCGECLYLLVHTWYTRTVSCGVPYLVCLNLEKMTLYRISCTTSQGQQSSTRTFAFVPRCRCPTMRFSSSESPPSYSTAKTLGRAGNASPSRRRLVVCWF